MTTRLHVVVAAADAPPPRSDTVVLVLDPAWLPHAKERPDLRAARTLLGEVVEGVDVVDGALELLDGWAEAAQLADRLLVEGTTYWFRVRETMWRWLHERLVWLNAFEALGVERLEEVVVPPDEDAIADVAAALGATVEPPAPPAAPTARAANAAGSATASAAAARPRPTVTSAARRLVAGLRRRLGRRPTAAVAVTPTANERRVRALGARVDALAGGLAERVLVLTTPATHQRVGVAGPRHDPNLGSVIPLLRDAGASVVLVGMGVDHRQDFDWQLLEGDPSMVPASLLAARWARPADVDRAEAAALTVVEGVRSQRIGPLRAGRADLGPAATRVLEATVSRQVAYDVRQLARVERLVAELRPSAILLTQEWIRLPWLNAARRARVPAFALQHGVLYRGHAGYPNRRHPALLMPDRTFVYGEFERRVLVDELAYEVQEVETSGSPRLDLDAAPPQGERGEREAIRQLLGVRDGDRLVVVSTVHLRLLRRAHLAPMIERVLGGPLPRVHLVFKQHPGEQDEGFYRALVGNLARAGGYEPPAVSVVKEIDLYGLLRAADAHLGLHSTVLTDAVAAGTLNLIAVSDAHHDLIGYVAAGVATPVIDPASFVAALDAEPSSDADVRGAFLDDHFRPGNASERIVASTLGRSIPTEPAAYVPR